MADDRPRLTLRELRAIVVEAGHVLDEELAVREDLSRRVAKLLASIRRPDDLLAQVQHAAWLEAKVAAGYHHPRQCDDRGFHRDARTWCTRCAAALLPWAELDEEEKAVRRAMVQALRADLLRRGTPLDTDADVRRRANDTIESVTGVAP